MAETDGEFFEEDEPVEDVLAAFEEGEKGITAPFSGQILAGRNFWTTYPHEVIADGDRRVPVYQG